MPDSHPAARLLSASAVREHCEEIFAYVVKGNSAHFIWHPARLAATALYVAEVIRERYPDLHVPYHSRWRHFEAGGVDRWSSIAREHGLTGDQRKIERVKARIDLVIPSVLLDAGAGADWRYLDAPTGQTLTRSEGLGVASLALFRRGAFSNDGARPLRSDAAALARIQPQAIADAFQVTAGNPLVGLDGRAALLARL